MSSVGRLLGSSVDSERGRSKPEPESNAAPRALGQCLGLSKHKTVGTVSLPVDQRPEKALAELTIVKSAHFISLFVLSYGRVFWGFSATKTCSRLKSAF